MIIVGAGPGGLNSAKILADAGKDVLVLERKSKNEIGDKVCSAGTDIRTRRYVPLHIFDRTLTNLIFRIGKYSLEIDMGIIFGGSLNRKKLAAWQVGNAKKSGAEVRDYSSVRSINRKEKQILLREGEKIGYNYLIGADGAVSIVRRSLGFNPEFVVAPVYIKKGYFENAEIWIDNFEKIGLGFGGFVPHKDYASFIPGGFTGSLAALIKDKFCEYSREMRGIDLSDAEFKAAPMSMVYHGFKFDNIFLVGEAASFVNFDGEGIYYSLKSGEIAAKAIIDKNYDYHQDVMELLKARGSFIYPIGGEDGRDIMNFFLKSRRIKNMGTTFFRGLTGRVFGPLNWWLLTRYISNRYKKLIGCPLPGIEITVEKVR